MRRDRKKRPTKIDISSDSYDSDFLIGHYQSLFLAHSARPDVRSRGASGGVTTELLINQLERGEIEGVIAVGLDAAEPTTPSYLFKSDPDGVRMLSGSVYCFMGLQSLRVALENAGPRQVAVVVQPCHALAVRQWQKGLFPNIKIIISFFCGYNMTEDAISYLLTKSKTSKGEVKSLLFRGGPYPGGFAVERNDGSAVCFGKECYELANLMFLRDGCSRCSLYMGEGADIAIGDAWIKEHPRHSAVACRTAKGEEIVRNAAGNGRLEVFNLQEKTLVRMHYHNLIYKKYGHSLPMRFLVTLFKSILPRTMVPFSLLTRLSYYRRKLKIGISIPALEKVKFELEGGTR